MVRRLFVRVGEPEQPAFVPRPAKDRQARGECAAAGEAHWDGDCGKTGRRCIDLAVVAGQIEPHIADNRRRIAPCWIDERIELQLRYRSEHRIAILLAIVTTRLASRTVVASCFG